MIKVTRTRMGIGVRELARRAGVAPSAVTQWEQSEARGVLRPATLERALAAMGTTVSAEQLSQHAPQQSERREDRVARELHRSVAGRLIEDPDAVLALVPANVRRLRTRVRGGAGALLDVWEDLAARREIGRLVDVMLSTSARAIEMRQVSPFAGVLDEEERLRAIGRAVS
ncbi:helix-turn-helix transcriptional regulator [Rathayibacter sp. VKM Ac-2760]|uniref:helix-turn-helix domain-containing protein n=1 Tax=Rathayibacter sp. VKM Ac-2760 TaxID=2609253 RepID=UPI001315E59F|nr:helix-turn-helix transcriptional regulator [Rathayibacter sp. VKM Ac-2760]QHC60486.1 helix-turn-helix domain-containing protein [Rathayibacter sp. VKM Ac-2760]